MPYKIEDCVLVKGIGPAKVKYIAPNGTFGLYFATGKYGEGWPAGDFEGRIPDREFWAEWRRCRRYR